MTIDHARNFTQDEQTYAAQSILPLRLQTLLCRKKVFNTMAKRHTTLPFNQDPWVFTRRPKYAVFLASITGTLLVSTQLTQGSAAPE